jgi:hypothetical protein
MRFGKIEAAIKAGKTVVHRVSRRAIKDVTDAGYDSLGGIAGVDYFDIYVAYADVEGFRYEPALEKDFVLAGHRIVDEAALELMIAAAKKVLEDEGVDGAYVDIRMEVE